MHRVFVTRKFISRLNKKFLKHTFLKLKTMENFANKLRNLFILINEN